MHDAIVRVPQAHNEPNLSYAPGSTERARRRQHVATAP